MEQEIHNTHKTNPLSIDLYVDGAYRDKRASWAFIAMDCDTQIYSNCGKLTEAQSLHHNISGEVSAVIHALQWAVKEGYKTANITYDYEGLKLWITGEWKAKNKLTQRYVELINNFDIIVSWHWVKGHTGNVGNESVDRIATMVLNSET